MDINLIIKSFKKSELINQALTHRSWVNEHPGNGDNNERLEFLGDAILEFIVSEYLFSRFTDKEEGYLTALRANLVNTVNLAAVARSIGIGKYLQLSKGEEEGGGRDNTSLLADTVEAIIGAIYLDRGIVKAKEFINKNILIRVDEIIKKPLKDAKSTLQEIVQAKGYLTPKYNVVKEIGPDHAKIFVVEVAINGDVLSTGEGKSKAEAEQQAAEEALSKFL